VTLQQHFNRPFLIFSDIFYQTLTFSQKSTHRILYEFLLPTEASSDCLRDKAVRIVIGPGARLYRIYNLNPVRSTDFTHFHNAHTFRAFDFHPISKTLHHSRIRHPGHETGYLPNLMQSLRRHVAVCRSVILFMAHSLIK
jgi:hypothetical protein